MFSINGQNRLHRLWCPTVEDVIAGAVIEAMRLTKLGRPTVHYFHNGVLTCNRMWVLRLCGAGPFLFMSAYRISLPRETLRSNGEFFVSENLLARKNKRSF